MTTPPHFRDENNWELIPESEIDRLQQTLYPHLRKMKISSTKPQRIQCVKDFLEKQKNTCAFGKNVGGKYCWNEPKDSEKKYLHLCTFKTPIINTFSLGFYKFYFLEHIFLSYYKHLPKCSYNILSV